MTINNRVVWSEGLFLRPQHFQQQDRFVERYMELRSAALRAHGWGFTALELDRDLLATGKLALRSAKGVFPDGTPFAMPDDDPVPPAVDVPEDAREQTVYLAIPLRRAGAVEISRGNHDADPTRFKLAEIEVRDSSGLTDAQALVEVAGVQARVMLEDENRESYAGIPMARVVECRADRQVVLDDQFIPTVARSATAPRLAGFLRELNGLLHQRGEALGGRAAASGRGASAEIADYLMLQAVNRYEPIAAHLQASGHVHPEDLYVFAAALAGELATYTLSSKRPQPLESYQHDDLRATFDPLMNAVRRVLSAVLEQAAVPIPLEEKRFGIRVGVVGDRSLFGTAVFVVAAKANLPAETLRASFVRQAKIGPVEKIAELVNHQLPGIVLKPMPSPPRQVPYHAGFQYFELDQNGDLFRQLPTSGAIAMHLAQVGDEFSGLELELWAIRG